MDPENKINILRIFSRLNIGGPSLHTILLTAGLNNNKFKSTLIVGTEGKSEGSMQEFAFSKNISPIIIPEMSREISLKNDFIALIKIFQLIRISKPDIIHTHTAKAGFLGRVAVLLIVMIFNSNLYFTKPKIKVFHTYHGNVYKGYFSNIKSLLFIYVEKFLARFTTKIICITDSQKKEIINLGITKPNRIVTIPLGLELSKLLYLDEYSGNLKKELNIDNETLLVGIVARLVPIKNHMMFLKGIIDLQKKNDHLKFKALIIGNGECRKTLEQYAKTNKLEEIIHFLGFRNDLENIYADLDIVALTSNNEGSPVALIEAMTSRIPVISTNVGGVGDLMGVGKLIINSGEFYVCDCGILVRPEDEVGFGKALEYLITNPKKRSKMGSIGKNIVYPQYDISRLIHDVEFLYNSHVIKNSK